MRSLLLLVLSLAVFTALFVRTFTAPPAPDRRGGTTIMLTWPNRAMFGSPRSECLGRPEAEPIIPCLIGSLARGRSEGLARLELPFCGFCLDLSERIALLTIDERSARAKRDQMARFGW